MGNFFFSLLKQLRNIFFLITLQEKQSLGTHPFTKLKKKNNHITLPSVDYLQFILLFLKMNDCKKKNIYFLDLIWKVRILEKKITKKHAEDSGLN